MWTNFLSQYFHLNVQTTTDVKIMFKRASKLFISRQYYNLCFVFCHKNPHFLEDVLLLVKVIILTSVSSSLRTSFVYSSSFLINTYVLVHGCLYLGAATKDLSKKLANTGDNTFTIKEWNIRELPFIADVIFLTVRQV